MFFKDKNRKNYNPDQVTLESEKGFIPSGTIGDSDDNEDEGYETSKSYGEENLKPSGMSGGFSADSDQDYNPHGSGYSNQNKNKVIREDSTAIADTERYSNNPAPETQFLESSDAIIMEFKKMDAKINSIVEWIKTFYERFSPVAENFGKFRRMQIDSEEKIKRALEDSSKALEMLSIVDLEKIKTDYNRLDSGNNAVKRDISRLIGEVSKLNERASIFISTNELLKLNEEVKNNLNNIKNISSQIKERADKIEKIKLETTVSPDIKKEIEKSSALIQRISILSKQNKEALGEFTYADYQEKIDTILEVVEKLATEVSGVKKNISQIKGDFESLSLKKKNEAIEELQKIGEIPDLPELPSQKIKKFKKNKKKN